MSIAFQPDLVENFFAVDVAAFTAGLAKLDEQIDSHEVPTRDSRYLALLDLLDQNRAACRRLEAEIGGSEVTLRETQRRFQEAISPWFQQSWMMNHALTKPQGYAGDYQMLTTIYEREAKSTGLGGLLDLFFLQTELGRAVPARKDALQDFLNSEFAAREGEIAVLDVACGPCREFADGVAVPPGRSVQVTFVDYDEDSLAYAQESLPESNDTLGFHFVRYNALRMQAPARFIGEHGKFDIVYSVGLCDYLNDRQLIAMLRGWRGMLRDDGVLYVAFKDMNCYDKTDYQWLVDWFFLERDEEDCRQLFVDAGYAPGEIAMQRDETGIIMNFSARQTPARRIDAPHDAVPRSAADSVQESQTQRLPK
ncbi:MAG: class I SAM-dependent methyltransferase [Planctomycetales bacterium]|nr:class I SAM-dependent methyltransferase [Planctomycetales bacterium]